MSTDLSAIKADLSSRITTRQGNARIDGRVYGFTGVDPVLGTKVYTGRPMRDLKGSVLGNYEYKVTSHNPVEHDRAVAAHQQRFDVLMQRPASAVYQAVDQLAERLAKGEKLALTCWCPDNLNCHGRSVIQPKVIELAIDKVLEQQQDLENPVKTKQAPHFDLSKFGINAKLMVMGADQVDAYCGQDLPDAAISIGNPGSPIPYPLAGLQEDRLLRLEFNDVQRSSKTKQAVAPENIKQAVMLARDYLSKGQSLLIHCETGHSCAPGMALAILFDQGLEQDEVVEVLGELQLNALPNGRMVRLIDEIYKTNYTELLPYAATAELTEQDLATIDQFQWTPYFEDRTEERLASVAIRIHAQSSHPLAADLSPEDTRHPVWFKGQFHNCVRDAYTALKEPLDNQGRIDLMVELLATKLRQNPHILEELTDRGGTNWLEGCEYVTSNAESPWNGKGADSLFIDCLMYAYEREQEHQATFANCKQLVIACSRAQSFDIESSQVAMQHIHSTICQQAKVAENWGIDSLRVIAGGALGVDTWAAQAAIALRDEQQQMGADSRVGNIKIEVVIAVPCRGQDARWNTRDKRDYAQMLDAADRVQLVDTNYYQSPRQLFARNEAMIDQLTSGRDSVAIVQVGASKGTQHTFDYARQQGLTVYHYDPQKQSLREFRGFKCLTRPTKPVRKEDQER